MAIGEPKPTLTRSRIALLLGAMLVLAAPATPAIADDATCSYDAGTQTITVNVTPADDFGPLINDAGSGDILITDDDVGPTFCGGRVENTDTIVINNVNATQPLVSGVGLGMHNPFGPGATDEPGSSDEIEFEAHFGPGGTLGLAGVFGTSDPGVQVNVVVGGNQLNFNAGEADGIDADVTLDGVTEVVVNGGSFDDRIDGSGGTGTPPEPTEIPITTCLGPDFGAGNDLIVGGNGNDLLCGGHGTDDLDGARGNDRMFGDDPKDRGVGAGDVMAGGPGNDFVIGSVGRDKIDAGRGKDRIRGGPTGDRIVAGPGADKVGGRQGHDLIRGNRGRDRMRGGRGKDRMWGNGGNDRLAGGKRRDRLNGGPSLDLCRGGPGPDLFVSCELGVK